jgi:hypothetical protein
MVRLLADLRFDARGAGHDHVMEGWAPPEPGHRWTVGELSHVRLPLDSAGPDSVVAIDGHPWVDASALPRQTIMLAVNGRLLATFTQSDHRTLAFVLPEDAGTNPVLSFCHLNSRTERPASGLDHQGRPLGLLVTSIRLFHVPPTRQAPATRVAFPGTLADGSLQRAACGAAGLAPDALMGKFESIGENCEFGLVQRAFGAEPLGLLRFASLVTHFLVDGLMTGFAGVGQPENTRIYLSDAPESEFKVHERLYYLWYSTQKKAGDTDHETVLREQSRRLQFLQRKFVEDLQDGEKIYVLTRPLPLTEPEALAVFCALNLHAPNTLLWTIHGDPSRAGQVDQLRPGFLLGHLGTVDSRNYASWESWLSVLANAYLLSRR